MSSDRLLAEARQVLVSADQELAKADAVLQEAERRKVDRRAFDKLECPYCKSMQSSVVDCRPGTTSGGFWRRRKCRGCGRRFVTEEVVRGAYPDRSEIATTSRQRVTTPVSS
jgi:transposase-like protein